MSQDDLPTKAEARLAGAKFYLTGKPCKRGHIAKRYVNNGHCTVCAAEHQKAWWGARPPEEKVNRWREWFAENREHRNAYKRDHPWYPPAEKRWDRINPEGAKRSWQKYYDNNREAFRTRVRNRAARVRAAKGSHSAADIRDILRAQRWKCAYCRHDLKAGYHVDHIIAIAVGGANDRANLQMLCARCNMRKGAKHPIVFAQQMGLLL